MKSSVVPKAIGWFIRILIVVGVVGAIFLNPFKSGEQTSIDTAVIKLYDATMDINRDGDLALTETLLVEMPAGKHGIYRIFDTRDPRRRTVKHPVTVISVERDGNPEFFTDVDTASGTRTIRIGNAGVVLEPGLHRYVIKSQTTDVFEAGDDPDTTLWWWDIVGAGWQMRMDSTHVEANLPATPRGAECVQGKDTPCTATIQGRKMVVDTGPLAPFEPVTVQVDFPAAALPAPATSNPILTIVFSVLVALIAGGVALAMVLKTHEKPVGLPATFEPPEGIYPALGAKVLNEIDSPYALQSTLFDLAERGLLSLESDYDGWEITVVAEPSQTVMNAAEAAVLADLGLRYNGAKFTLRKNKTAGEAVSKAQRTLNSQVSVDSKPYVKLSGIGGLGALIGWAALAATFFQLFIYFFGAQRIYWPILSGVAAFAFVSASILLDRAAWSVRTPYGREMWSRVGGFGRFLTTDSAETRFDFAHRMDLYPKFLPWALVLGSADAWAQRYRDQGVEPPTVPWLLWYGAPGGYSMTSMTDSFNSTISGAASAYAASQASSGGGGGFSGGSGGGGGGGGSW